MKLRTLSILPSKNGREVSPHLNAQIRKLAFPAIVNNVTVPLLGLCDTAIAGHLGDASYIGGMAVGALMLNVIYWLCGFLRMGTSGLTARAFGASDFTRQLDILRKSLSIAFLFALVAILFRHPLESLLIFITAPDPEVASLASRYFLICIWASPAQLGIMALSGWFIGRQNTVVPMCIAIGVNVVNIILSVSLVFGFGLGFDGIALGTLSAGWTGLVSAAVIVLRIVCRERRAADAVTRSGNRVRWSRFFSLNTDLFFRSACIICVSTAMTSVGARLGETVLAANAVIMQFFLFFSYFMDGFAFAGEALVGKAAGASDMAEVRRCVRALCLWGAAMSIIFFLTYLAGSGAIASLLTDEAGVRAVVADLRLWVVLLPPVTVWAFIFDGVFIGLTRTRPLLFVTLAASAAFFLIAFLLPGWGSLPSDSMLWAAFETYLLLRGLLLALLYGKTKRNSLIL